MEAIINKVEKLEIDTKSIPSSCTKWVESEEPTKDQLIPIPIDFKRPHQQEFNFPASPIKQHKRSMSANYDYITGNTSPSHSQSSPDLKLHKYSSQNKKRWFQLPRMTLKRQQSTPPRRGIGGLKAGLVEPPEPPPQLLFNLDWSTSLKSSSTLWENDVNHSASTPVTPVASRRSSSNYLDTFIPEEYNNRHKKSLSFSSASTIVPEKKDTIQLDHDILAVRRLSCLVYDQKFDVTSNTPSKSECCNTSTKLFPAISTENMSPLQTSPSSSTSTSSLSSSSTPPPSPSILKNNTDYRILLSNVYTPDTNELVINFRNIQPRTVKLKRRNNWKSEQKALHEWQTQLISRLNHSLSVQHRDNTISPEKKARYFLTRRFILQEFYTTEITFWNQLNYTKVMFCDPLKLALERGSISARPNDMDGFANLPDLMSFSSTLIHRLRQFQVDKIICKDAINDPNCQIDDMSIGIVLRDMTKFMMIFLRCALDYKSNKKLLDQKKSNKGYALYNEKLTLKKETRQFTLGDYLIIPIQRVTRYGLLLVDLEKHTESSHPDYKNIKIALCIIQSLASAMNSAQN